MRRLAPKKSWRSPEGGDALGCERARKNPPQQETAHGEGYRAGCPRVKLHAGGHDAERQADRVARGVEGASLGLDGFGRRVIGATRRRIVRLDGAWQVKRNQRADSQGGECLF